MRILRGSLLAILLGALLGCVPATPAGPTLPSAVATPQQQAPSPSPTALITPTSLPARAEAVGPLTVDGQLLTAVVVVPGSTVRYGVLGQGLARSEDRGQAWRQVSDRSLPLPVVSPRDPATLYAGDSPSCYKDEAKPSFWRSTDGGRNWVELQAGQGIKPVAVVAGAGGPDRLYGVSCEGLFSSPDGGETWELTGPTLGWDITSILPIRDGDLRFLAVLTSEGGASHLAWFDQDGRLARDLSEGFNFWGVGVLAQADSTLYIADSTGVWRQTEPDGEWQRFAEGLEDVVLATDPMTEGLSEADVTRGFGLFALAPDPSNPRRLALGTVRGLYFSEDGGEHWSPAGLEALAGSRINRLAWDPSAPGVLYATTPGGVLVVRLPG